MRPRYVLAVLGALAVYSVGSEIYYGKMVSPQGITSAREYVNHFGVPTSVRLATHEGQTYFEFSGQTNSPYLATSPSDAPTYLFDDAGKFVTWCSDPNDMEYYRRAFPLQNAQPLALSEVEAKLGLTGGE